MAIIAAPSVSSFFIMPLLELDDKGDVP